MTFVTINGIKGYLNKEQQQEMIEKVTDAIVSVEGEALRDVIWVTVQDVESGLWGVGGKGYTAGDLRQMVALSEEVSKENVTILPSSNIPPD